jgi:hypothetical protein
VQPCGRHGRYNVERLIAARSADANPAMPTIDLTDADLATLVALIRRAIQEDRSPRVSTRCARLPRRSGRPLAAKTPSPRPNPKGRPRAS